MTSGLADKNVNVKVKTLVTIILTVASFVCGAAIAWANSQNGINEVKTEIEEIKENRFTDKDGELLGQMINNNEKRIQATEQKFDNLNEKIDNKFERLFLELTKIQT